MVMGALSPWGRSSLRNSQKNLGNPSLRIDFWGWSHASAHPRVSLLLCEIWVTLGILRSLSDFRMHTWVNTWIYFSPTHLLSTTKKKVIQVNYQISWDNLDLANSEMVQCVDFWIQKGDILNFSTLSRLMRGIVANSPRQWETVLHAQKAIRYRPMHQVDHQSEKPLPSWFYYLYLVVLLVG